MKSAVAALLLVLTTAVSAFADCSTQPWTTGSTSSTTTPCPSVGINMTTTPQWTLDVNGNVGINGAPAVIRPSTPYDAQGLKFMGTQLVIGGLNSRAYGYTGSALGFIGSWYDGTELLRLSSNADNAYVSVTQTSTTTLNADFKNTSLHVFKSAPTTLGPELRLDNTGGAVGDASAVTFQSIGVSRGQILSTVDGNAGGTLSFSVRSGNGLAEMMRITSDGLVNIGQYTTPQAGDKLVVNGTVRGTSIVATYQDVAEWVPASSEMEPGTVVVLNPRHANEVMPSSSAYDETVAGVVSAQPGVILGVAAPSKAQIATTGRVRVHADASRTPIRIGDLLVTSDKPGVAMRSDPIDIGGRKFHQPGTIIGKALEALDGGKGDVLVLLSLQ